MPLHQQSAPPRRAERRSGPVVVLVALTLSLVVAVAIAGWLAFGDPRPFSTVASSFESAARPSTPPPTAQDTTAAPTAHGTTATPIVHATEPPVTPPSEANVPGQGAAAPWQLPERVWDPLPTPAPQGEVWAALQAIELRDEPPQILTKCPAVQVVDTEAEYQDAVRQQWRCVHTAWVPLFERQGWSTTEPAVEFYPGTGADSECGHLEAPAFYCSAGEGKVHFGSGHVDMAAEWDLSINEMVNHEYAHHVQSLAGITAAKLALEPTDELERRAELQATCWSAAMTRNSETVDFDQAAWDSWQERLQTMTIDGIHGSRESILYWGTRGLYATTLGECNTWAVDAAMVT